MQLLARKQYTPWHILTRCFHFGFKVYSTPYLQQTQSCQNLCQACSSVRTCSLQKHRASTTNMVACDLSHDVLIKTLWLAPFIVSWFRILDTPRALFIARFLSVGTSDSFHLKVWTSHHISIIASTHGGSSRCVSSACFGTFFWGGWGLAIIPCQNRPSGDADSFKGISVAKKWLWIGSNASIRWLILLYFKNVCPKMWKNRSVLGCPWKLVTN